MPDALLFLHRVQGSRDVYDTGSVQSPGSIRDQVLRGQWIAERAVENGRIGPTKPLLVVGAGAAGVSASLTAAARGVVVHLVDRENGPFSRQNACTTRFVDPSVYEWPLGHHTDLVWGNAHPTMPLPYGPTTADQLVVGWQGLVAPTANLKTHWAYEVRAAPRPLGGALLAELHPAAGGPSVQITAAAALWASGAGDEDTTSGTYRGYRFWDDDPYGNAVLLPGAVPARIVISGGGDGALQDLMRLAFDPTQVRNPRDLLPLLQNLTESELRELSTAEEQAQRALIWNGGDRERLHDHSVLAHLHGVHAGIAARYAGRAGVAAQVRALLRNPFPSITFLHPCEHFSRCYPLNRFMVLLLLAILARAPRIVHRPQRSIAGVTPSGAGGRVHVCADPMVCHGEDHSVTVASRSCTTPPSPPSRLGDFNIVVLRHGLSQRATPAPTLRVRRQLLPYQRR